MNDSEHRRRMVEREDIHGTSEGSEVGQGAVHQHIRQLTTPDHRSLFLLFLLPRPLHLPPACHHTNPRSHLLTRAQGHHIRPETCCSGPEGRPRRTPGVETKAATDMMTALRGGMPRFHPTHQRDSGTDTPADRRGRSRELREDETRCLLGGEVDTDPDRLSSVWTVNASAQRHVCGQQSICEQLL